tara:strand:- start:530 stop:1570 length:1041 start_codon:yes stop_codon:yes gene_type:complete
MSQNTYCNPKIFIDDEEIKTVSSISYSTSVGTMSSLSVTFSNTNLENKDFFNKSIEFFLNDGSEDSSPMFRGLVKSSTLATESISVRAVDIRTLISGNDSFKVVIDDTKNYDGQTIMQFLIDVIDNEMENKPSWFSTHATNDMDKPVFMTGERGVISPYDKVKELLSKKLDSDDLTDVGEYFFDVFHDGEKSSIIVKKTRKADINNYDYSLTYYSGIIEDNITNRPSPSYAIGESEDGSRVRLDYGNAPQGSYGTTITGNFSSRGEAREKMLPFLLSKQDSEKEISLKISSHYYAELGNIINIDVPNENLAGQYRITSKNISFNNDSVDCRLSLNKKPATIKDYLT